MIRKAQQEGAFDNLPGAGKPIPGIDQPYDPMWWARRKLRDEGVSVLPPPLKLRRDIERALPRIMTLGSEEAVRRAVAVLQRDIRSANVVGGGGPIGGPYGVDEASILAAWRRRRADPRHRTHRRAAPAK